MNLMNLIQTVDVMYTSVKLRFYVNSKAVHFEAVPFLRR